MVRVIYVNGRYQRYADASVHVEDRGFQFADAVYEVIEIRGRSLIDEARHMARLDRSLRALGIPAPMSSRSLSHIIRQTILRNRVVDGTVYLQITRGRGPRDFLYCKQDLKPSVICIARAQLRADVEQRAEQGIGVVTMPDIRWRRCDIKTVMLLPGVLAKIAAQEQGADEAWFVDDDGFVVEGASSNAWIVDNEGRLITRQIDQSILPGVTRMTAIDVARDHMRLVVDERAFSVEEALGASEAFVTSASAAIMPVVSIDGRPLGSGRPGPVATQLRARFLAMAPRSIEVY